MAFIEGDTEDATDCNALRIGDEIILGLVIGMVDDIDDTHDSDILRLFVGVKLGVTEGAIKMYSEQIMGWY